MTENPSSSSPRKTRRRFGRIRRLQPSGRFQAGYIATDGKVIYAPMTFPRQEDAEAWLDEVEKTKVHVPIETKDLLVPGVRAIVELREERQRLKKERRDLRKLYQAKIAEFEKIKKPLIKSLEQKNKEADKRLIAIRKLELGEDALLPEDGKDYWRNFWRNKGYETNVCKNCNLYIVRFPFLNGGGTWRHIDTNSALANYSGCRAASFDSDSGWDESLSRSLKAKPKD